MPRSDERYDIDLADLERQYWRLQKQLHPDRWSHVGEVGTRRAAPHLCAQPIDPCCIAQREHDVASVGSAAVNSAYRTLKNPSLRAQYMVWPLLLAAYSV